MNYGRCYDPYDPGYGGKAQPGMVALSVVCMDLFGVGTLGIVRDRSRCRKASTHCYGRGWDAKTSAYSKVGLERGDKLCAALIAHAEELGVQRLIWNRREWNIRLRKWVAYHGASNHTDHVHVELCWKAARDIPLTKDYVLSVLAPIHQEVNGLAYFEAQIDGRKRVVVAAGAKGELLAEGRKGSAQVKALTKAKVKIHLLGTPEQAALSKAFPVK